MSAHLNAHSYYSLLAGIPKPSHLAAAAAAAGQPALALTDHNRLTGAIEFTVACKEQGVKAILGMDVNLQTMQGQNEERATLLATDITGWGTLCRLSSWLLNEEGSESNPLPFEKLEENNAGLICLACVGKQSGLRLKYLFGDRLYLQLPQHSIKAAERIQKVAEEIGAPLVATWPIYYLKPEQARLQRTLAAMRLNTTVDRLEDEAAAPEGSFFPSNEEMLPKFAKFPEALEATNEIAARCNFELPLDQPNFPELKLPGEQTPIEVLRKKSYEGAQRLYPELNPEITARLEHELEGIQNSGYTTLFLIMEEIISFAHQADVPIASRGSAASSLIAHCLGITTPDPIRLNLYFERFLNPARPTPPDVDTDICSRRRDIVIQHVYEHYGSERVAMVATINRFRRRSALREVAKAHGLTPAQIKARVDTLPWRFWRPGTQTQKEESPYAELQSHYRDERFKQIFAEAEAILDSPHHLSIHPGGVVISAGPLNDLVPTQYSGKGVTITQYDLGGVQRMGLVKMDLLGIRGLTVLGDVADAVREQHPELGNSRLEILEQIPEHDPATAEIVREGRTIGCFQIESPGMRGVLQEVQSDSIDNVMLALALFRPGPLTGGLKDAFIRRHLGQEEVHHLHPALAPLLEDTHGVFLYQEQVLRVVHELAGFSLTESDLLRRAMSHFDPGKQMQTLKEKFIRGAGERHKVPPALAERIWEMMAKFAGYGFPKAHSASYAQTAWRSAWCKAHYPAEFMAAVLANWGGYYDQKTYLAECLRLGLKLHGPHINHSRSQFSVSYVEGEPQLYMGMDQLRYLTHETQRRIVQLRPFNSLADFLTRAYPRKGEAQNLIEIGALDGLGTIPNLLGELESGEWKKGQMPLFDREAENLADWSTQQKAAGQRRLLGISLLPGELEASLEASTERRAFSREMWEEAEAIEE